MNKPGIAVSHQALKMYWRPVATMPPQVAMEGGTPRPRKVRDASDRIAPAISSVPWTMALSITLGRMCITPPCTGS